MDKYYIGDCAQAAADGYTRLALDELIDLENSVVFIIEIADGSIFKRLKSWDNQGIIHLGLRNFNSSALSTLPFARIGSNFIIYSKSFNEIRYDRFKNFTIPPKIVLPKHTYVNIEDISEDEACSYIDKLYELDTSSLGIDFESNGFPEYASFFPLGVGITDKDNGIYFDFDDYNSNRTTKTRFYSKLREFIVSNASTLWAFNCSFEIRALYYMYKEFIEVQDTRAWCIVDGKTNNLKYCAQYYLGAESWDDDVAIEQEGLSVLFKYYDKDSATALFEEYLNTGNITMTPEIAHEIKINPANKGKVDADIISIDKILRLFNNNKDNPKFKSRLVKFWGSTWACCNQVKMGEYCVYDAVMDLHIKDKIMTIESDPSVPGSRYTEKAYRVYLYNQYLEAQIRLSGIVIDPVRRAEILDFYERCYFNSGIYLSQEFLHIKRESIDVKIQVPINDKIEYSVKELNSYFFVASNNIGLGKNFLLLLRKHPDCFDKLITKYDDELYYLRDIAADLAKFKAFNRKRTVFETIGKMIFEEMELADYYERFNAEYNRVFKINEKALKYWSKSEDELIESIKKGTLKNEVPAAFYPDVSKYIVNPRVLQSAAEVKNSLEVMRIDALLEKYKSLADRDIASPVDPDLRSFIAFDFNSPKVRSSLNNMFQSYFELDCNLMMIFFTTLKRIGKRETHFTFSNYLKFKEMTLSKYPNIEDYPDYYDATHVTINIPDPKNRWKSIGTKVERRKWNINAMGAPYSNGAKFADRFIDDSRYLGSRDLSHLDHKVYQFCKLAGFYRINRAASKVLSTYISAAFNDTYNYIKMDESHVQYLPTSDIDKPLMQKINVMANFALTKRWTSGFHTLPAGNDVRKCMIYKKGTEFTIKKDKYQIGYNTEDDPSVGKPITVVSHDDTEYYLRWDDKVKLICDVDKYAHELVPGDSVDIEWLKSLIANEDKEDNYKEGDLVITC